MVKEPSTTHNNKYNTKVSGKITKSMAQVKSITLLINQRMKEPTAMAKSVDKVHKLGLEEVVITLANGLTT